MHATYLARDEAGSIDGGVAVVVDVMRAFTVAAWALHLGAERLTLVDDIEQAVDLAAEDGSLLFKDGVPDPRFDLHNSPRQLLDLDVAGRSIVQRTTAGTRSAVAARGADTLFCTGLVSASATAAAIAELGAGACTFVVSGGLQAEEDLACAELIAGLVTDPSLENGPFVERAGRSKAAERLKADVAAGYTGVTAEDVPMCLDVDRFDTPLLADLGGPHPVLRAPGTPR
ncbi:MAG: 2-phosphosulfolactate phosphatase [Actinomycetota bacterium]